MKILQPKNLIYFNIIFFGLIIPNFEPALTEVISSRSNFINSSKNSYLKEKFEINSVLSNQLPEIDLNLALKENSDQSRNIEIQSDKQSQEENVIYADGNVLVTYQGNILRADSLIYDKLNGTLNANGNIQLILENQVFTLEKLTYNFKTQKGSFSNVKGLIQTKNLIDNLDLTSNEFQEKFSSSQKIKKAKVLYTPDGINNWIFYTEELKVDKNQWTAKKAIFTNDLLETNQVKFEINSLSIIPKNDELKLKSSLSYLIFEDKLPIPFGLEIEH